MTMDFQESTEQLMNPSPQAQDGTWNETRDPGLPFFAPSSFLPPHPPLVGREWEQENLRQRLCGSTAGGEGACLALDGVAGVGKTRLAVELASDPEVRACFTGGILVASPGQHAAFDALHQWTRQLDLQDQRGWSTEERFRHIVEALDRRGEPALLIIDDVWSVEDARLFLTASPRIGVLYTCRQQTPLLPPIGLEHLIGQENVFPLEPLSNAHAADLLRHFARIPPPEGQEELEALAALAGGLPLLLSLMGGYLCHQRPTTQEAWFARAIEDLKEAAKRLSLPTAPIEQAGRVARRGFLAGLFGKPVPPRPLPPKVVLDLSVETLPRHMQVDAIRLAALPPDPLSVDHATAHAVAEPTDERSLALLVERNLLHETEDGRLCIHRMLCEWAEAEKRFYSEVRSAHRRLMVYHLDLLKPDNAGAFARWREHPDNWQQMLRTWEAATDDPPLLETCLTMMARPLIEQGYHDKVRAGLVRALSLFRENSLLLGLANYYLGLVDYIRAGYEQAVEYGEAALLHFQIAHEEKHQGMALTLLGQIARTRGDHPAARRYLEEVLLITPEADEVNYAISLLNLAVVLMEQQDYPAARHHFERSLALHRRVFGASHPRTQTIRQHLASLPETGPATAEEADRPPDQEQKRGEVPRQTRTRTKTKTRTTRKGPAKSGRRGPQER